ncbi:MAG: class I SAM-dependent methyltransferase [Candidatus Dormibacterales bacterium]
MEEMLTRLKAGAAWMWSLGNYSDVAPLLEAYSIELAAMTGIEPGAKVLDVAAGNGNFALAAAARGANVTACDFSPRMVELGRARTEAAAFDVRWFEADAEQLPFDEAGFDVVVSVFGAMFAPQPQRVAAELFRVCRKGGRVAMANYSREGFLGTFAGLLTDDSARPPMELPSPFDWGDEKVVARRFAGLASTIECSPGEVAMSFPSVKEGIAFWERTNGPQIALRNLLEADRYAEFKARGEGLMREMNRASGGRLELRSAYLNVIASK